MAEPAHDAGQGGAGGGGPAPESLPWDPMPVAEVADLLAGLDVPWWLAGGWAIELFVGRPLRPHGDTDVLIRRDDQLAVQARLAGWELHRATYPGLRPWRPGEFLTGRCFDIWCRRPGGPWRVQFMLLDTDGDRWLFKRDPSIGGPLAGLGRRTPDGVPYLAPEIQLLYKARPRTLAKDQIDFEAAAPLLDPEARAWLSAALAKRFPEGHRWLDELGRLE